MGLLIQDGGSNKTHPVILSQVTPGNPNNNSAKDREQISLNHFYPNLNPQAGAWGPFWGWWAAALGLVRQIPACSHPDLSEKTQQPSDLDDPVPAKHLLVASNRGPCKAGQAIVGCGSPQGSDFLFAALFAFSLLPFRQKRKAHLPIAAPHLWLQLSW